MAEVDAVLVWTSVGDAAVAEKLATTLVEERLAACVHRFPQGHSCYWWEGQVVQEEEWSLVIKSSRAGYARLAARLLALHPYEVPEILLVPVEQGHPPYLQWLAENLRP